MLSLCGNEKEKSPHLRCTVLRESRSREWQLDVVIKALQWKTTALKNAKHGIRPNTLEYIHLTNIMAYEYGVFCIYIFDIYSIAYIFYTFGLSMSLPCSEEGRGLSQVVLLAPDK